VEIIRDILLILVALFSLIALLMAILLFLQVRSFLRFLHREVAPILGSMKRTADTVEGTTRFVGRRAIGPLVTFVGVLVTVRRVLQVFTGGGSRR
jgi:hypothetical protein